MAQGGQFQNMAAFRKFALAGNAVFTIVSKKSGDRFTFRIRRGQGNKPPFFVQLLMGQDNTGDYGYIGLFFGKGQDQDFASWRHGGEKARAGLNTPSVKAIGWLFRNVMSEKVLEQVELWHQGKCGKCRKALTVPESIASGLGPICAKGGRD